MVFHPYQIDPAVSAGGGAVHVREGEYLLEIADIVIPKESEENSSYYRWAMLIDQGPDGIGRKLNYNTTCFSPSPSKAGGETSGQFALKNLLVALGMPESSLDGLAARTYDEHVKNGQNLLAKFRTRKVRALVADRAGNNGRIYSNIVELGPASEFRARPAFENAPVGAPAANNSTAEQPSDFLDKVSALFPEVPAAL